MSTIESKGVTVVPVDIDCRLVARRKQSSRVSVVGDEGDHDAVLSGLIFDVAKVLCIRELGHVGCSTSIFILWLVQDDRTAIRDLCFCKNGIDVVCVA